MHREYSTFHIISFTLFVIAFMVYFATFVTILFSGKGKDYKEYVAKNNNHTINQDLNKTDDLQIKNICKNIANPIMWERLTNKDVIAWIEVPNTNINYPIMYCDDDQYLLKGIDGKKSYAGSIYVRADNNSDFTDNLTVIYGHNMANGTMFGNLDEFMGEDLFSKQKYFYIYFPDESVNIYKIVSYGMTDDKQLMDKYQTETLEGFRKFQEYITSKNMRNVNNIDFDEKIVTLETCSIIPGQRSILNGFLVDKEEKE